MKKEIFTSKFNKRDYRFLLKEQKSRSFLLEVEGGTSMIEKLKQDENLPVYLVGLIQKGDTPNRNGRIYPFATLKRECERYLRDEIKDRQAFLELDHPAESTVPELKNAAAVLEDLWFKGNEVWGRVKLLNAFMPQNAPGKLARGIVLNGERLGISSRALGSVYTDNSGYNVVEDDLEIICWDLVSRESTYGANLRLTESKKVCKLLTEKQCFGDSCNLSTSKQIIKENKFKTLSEEDKILVECLGVERYLQLKN